MKRAGKSEYLTGAIRFAADTLTGRLGVAMMVAGYVACAVVLLGYVSTQVYTYSLMEDIHKRETTQRVLEETIGLQTQRFAELASRNRIIPICESRLGMIPAAGEHLQRVAVDSRWSPGESRSDFEEEPVDLPGMMGRDINEITEVMQR